jgi:3-methylfumaryl-CoA hydratase
VVQGNAIGSPQLTAEAEEIATDHCCPQTVARIAALLDLDPEFYRSRATLPNGWHFAFFLPSVRQSDLRADGHAAPASLGDASAMGQTVVAGSRSILFTCAIPIGATIRRHRRILSITPKVGRTGPLTIVRRESRITVDGSPKAAIVDTDDTIYRRARAFTPSSENQPPKRTDAPSPIATTRRIFEPVETLLQRYSALTFNAHRIHYDRRYAVEIERYPDLVVNGGLTALVLLELFRSTTGREAATVKTRHLAPLYCGQRTMLEAFDTSEGWRITAIDEEGRRIADMAIT